MPDYSFRLSDFSRKKNIFGQVPSPRQLYFIGNIFGAPPRLTFLAVLRPLLADHPRVAGVLHEGVVGRELAVWKVENNYSNYYYLNGKQNVIVV